MRLLGTLALPVEELLLLYIDGYESAHAVTFCWTSSLNEAGRPNEHIYNYGHFSFYASFYVVPLLRTITNLHSVLCAF